MSYIIIIIILIADGHTTSHMKVNWKRGFDKSDVTENNSISLAQVRMWDSWTIGENVREFHNWCECEFDNFEVGSVEHLNPI